MAMKANGMQTPMATFAPIDIPDPVFGDGEDELVGAGRRDDGED